MLEGESMEIVRDVEDPTATDPEAGALWHQAWLVAVV